MGLFIALFLSRHFLFSTLVQTLLSRVTDEKFEYTNRSWDNGSLIYENVVLGDQLFTPNLRLTPEFSAFPLHLSMEVYFTEPHFKLSSETQPAFNLAIFTPTKWTSFKLDIEKGALSIDDEPLGSIDFVSGETSQALGTLILSEQEGSSYCTCELSFSGRALCYQLHCQEAPVLHLYSLMNLFSIKFPFQLQGGRLDAELRGTFSKVQGSVTGSDLQFATPQGEFDLKRVSLTGELGNRFTLDGSLEGGRFSNEAIVIDEADAKICIHPEKTPQITLKGQLLAHDMKEAFICDAKGVCESRALEGSFQLGGLTVPFRLSNEGSYTSLQADFNRVPLTWLKQLTPFEEGQASGYASAVFENQKLKILELKNLHLSKIKINNFSCDSIKGQATLTGPFFVETALLVVQNLSYTSDLFKCTDGTATISIKENQFCECSLKGAVNKISGELYWQGPFENIEGEFLAAATLSKWIGNIINIDSPTHVRGFFQLHDSVLKWKADFLTFADKLLAKGEIDLNAMKHLTTFEAPSITLSNYSALFPEGSVELKGTIDEKEAKATCIGTDILSQTDSQMLQIPGKTGPLHLNYSLADSKLTAHMSLPPSTLYLKKLNSPIYLESGALSWKEGVLEITYLQACIEEIAFQGDLAYWHTPKPHLQLTSRTLEGSVQDLSIFDRRLNGWDGHFACGKEEFLLDMDLEGGAPHFHVKAKIDQLGHRFTPEISLSQGAFCFSYESVGGHIQIDGMKGIVSLNETALPFLLPKLTGKENHFSFALEIPCEQIVLAGEFDAHTITLAKANVGASKITQPLHIAYGEDNLQVKGGAVIQLENVPRYLSFVQAAGFLKEASLPSMHGTLEMCGSSSLEKASLDIVSDGIYIGDLKIPSFKGHIIREKDRFESENFSIGEAAISGHALYNDGSWLFPQWTALWKELRVHGSARLENSICSMNVQGAWKDQVALDGSLQWNIKTRQGKNGHLTLEKEALKVTLFASDLNYNAGKLEAFSVQTTVIHPHLTEAIIAPLSLSWTPQKIILQGPLTQGAYKNDLFTLKGRDIHALFENEILHFQSRLHLNDTPFKAKGHFFPLEQGRGAMLLTEGERRMELTFRTFSEISTIEGQLFGIDCSLSKKGALYEGRIKVVSSDPIAAIFNQPQWNQIQNIELSGRMTPSSFTGTISGDDVMIQGYLLNHLEANVDYHPTLLEIRQLKIEDKAGKLDVKECLCTRSHPLKAWEIAIPHLRGQHIEPSLLRKIDEVPGNPKPFQIRQLTLTDIKGIAGRPLTFAGHGSLYFTQKEKRDPSLFDLPRAFLKDWGLDIALLSPSRGTATIELKQGKIVISSLIDTFSDGDHSVFYLAENEPSYIDYSGSLFLNLRMKQNVALKLVEPFTLSVRGTWQKPLYTLR